jgi:hypothetical protein
MDERYDWELSEKALGLGSGAPRATKKATSGSRGSVVGTVALLLQMMRTVLR